MIKGTVTETHGERAKVRVNFKETTERGMRAYIDCWNPISAHPGDNVVIEYRKVDEKKAKWFQILLPSCPGRLFQDGVLVLALCGRQCSGVAVHCLQLY